MKFEEFKAVFAAALVAVTGLAAYAEDVSEEEVVAFGEAEFWLGPAGDSVEEVVAVGTGAPGAMSVAVTVTPGDGTSEKAFLRIRK